MWARAWCVCVCSQTTSKKTCRSCSFVYVQYSYEKFYINSNKNGWKYQHEAWIWKKFSCILLCCVCVCVCVYFTTATKLHLFKKIVSAPFIYEQQQQQQHSYANALNVSGKKRRKAFLLRFLNKIKCTIKILYNRKDMYKQTDRRIDRQQANICTYIHTSHKIIFSNVAFTIKYTHICLHVQAKHIRILTVLLQQQAISLILHLCHKWFCRDKSYNFNFFFTRE